MSDPTLPQFDRATIQDLFRQLGDRLLARGVTGELYIIGGAAMALAYDARRSTRDIDAVWLPHGIIVEEAGLLAEELGLPRWWLNEQASVYIAAGGDPAASVSFDHPGLRVLTASPEHLLSMKVLAARRRDVDDLRVLVGVLGLSTVADVVAVCARVFPDEPLPGRSMLVLADLFEAMAAEPPLGPES